MTDADHPSDLYRTIHAQPEILSSLFERSGAVCREAADLLRESERVYLVGTGSSYHAALAGEHLFRAAGLDARALAHLEFALYPPKLSSRDALVTISHRGTKRYGVASLGRARAARMRTIGITGQGSPMEGPSVVISTSPQESSSTHTASYTASLAALARISSESATDRPEGRRAFAQCLAEIPAQVAEILRREREILPLARHLAEHGRVVFAGAGPNRATATEGALKVKESSYLVSEGFELEALLHGGLQALAPGDLAVLAAADGPAIDRCADLVRALEILKARPWLVGNRLALDAIETAVGPAAGPARFDLPTAPELLSPILNVVPLQLLACFTAEIKGTNPDSFREGDPVFARISASYRL